jgi:TonB-linked SusC/RagA family outer membrane protein
MTQLRRELWYGVAALLALLSIGAGVARAQDAVIKGRVVSDRGDPVAGANVFIEELRLATNAANDGRYTLTLPGARVRGQTVFLRARGIGLKPGSKQITLNAGEQTVDFTLVYDVNLMQAVVVTGVQQGTEMAKLPFAVDQVTSAQMVVPAQDALTQLKGKVAGANIVSASGRPGAQPAVLLRGPTMINAQGRSQDPLYIVDGIVINGNLPDLNPNDIESVEVVKGAAGSSLYGARAGNGVIQITTKSGRHAADGIKFSIRSEAGISDVERDFGLARYTALFLDPSGQRFCEAVTGQPLCARTFDYNQAVARINNQPQDWAGNPPGLPLDPGATVSNAGFLRERFQNIPFPGTSYNAVAQTVDPHAHTENSVDMTGRFGGTTFYTSAEQYGEGGAIRFLEGAHRYSFRANVDQVMGSNWTLAIRTQYSRLSTDGLNQEGGGTAFFRLTRVPAVSNVLATDTLGRLYIRPNLQQGGQQNENPLYSLQNTLRSDITNRFLGGLQVQYTPTDWLNLSTNLSYDSHRVSFSQINDKGFRTTGPSAAPTTNNGNIFRGAQGDEAMNVNLNALVKRDLTSDLRTHYTFAYQFEDRKTEINTGQGNFLTFKGVTTLNNTQATGRTIASSGTEIKQLGLAAGAGFEWKGRYIFDGLVRRDGSSLFGADARWRTWGRVSGAWLMNQEPWWPLPELSQMKLRASYGTAGGSPQFSAQYETFGSNGGIATLGLLGNKLLRPEIHREMELGTDIELLNRYLLTVTYAHAKIEDQILPAPVSASTGFTGQWQNAGTLDNKTWELSLNVPMIQRRDASWSMRFIYSRNRSVISKLDVPLFFFGGGNQGNTAMFRASEGERFGTLYGHRFVVSCSELPAPYNQDCGGATSSYQRNDEGFIVWVGAGNSWRDGITKNLWETSHAAGAFSVPGKNIVENWGMPILIRDGGGNPMNLPLGNALPDFQFGVTQDITWRRFSLYALVDASIGQKVFDEGFHWAHLDFLSKDVDQTGKSVSTAKPIGYYWRTNAADGFSGLGGYYDQLGPNNYTVEDASYAKLRELSVSYRIGPIGGAGDWAISLIGRNLFTITGYRGFDPEVGLVGGEAGSGAINAVDDFTFPNLRSFTFAVRSTF